MKMTMRVFALRAMIGILVLAAFLAGCRAEEGRLLDPKAAHELMQRHDGSAVLVLVDVRTPEEFAQGHLQGARLMDFHAPDFRDRLATLDRKAPTLFYCRSGNRSSHTLKLAQEMGFENAYDLGGGVNAWKKAGYALTGGE